MFQPSKVQSLIKQTMQKLPGGKTYQKGGLRLEKAFCHNVPRKFQDHIKKNVVYRNSEGNTAIEFDMIYSSEREKKAVSFEIKGVNQDTINNIDRQKKIIEQGLRQKKFLQKM